MKKKNKKKKINQKKIKKRKKQNLEIIQQKILKIMINMNLVQYIQNGNKVKQIGLNQKQVLCFKDLMKKKIVN